MAKCREGGQIGIQCASPHHPHDSSSNTPLRPQLIDRQTGLRIAEFRKVSITHDKIGRIHGQLQLWFNDETLLREAFVSLCLNRWMAMP
jgi:hypothetical protein